MSDEEDIVPKLRDVPKGIGGYYYNLIQKSADEIQLLRAERDEARQSVCKMSIRIGGVFRRVNGKTVEVTNAEGCAEMMGWDCFKENTNGK